MPLVVRNEESGSRVHIRNPDNRITDQKLGSGSKIKKNGNYERKRKRLTLCFCFVLGTENDEFKKLNVRSSAESPILIPKSPRTMAGS